MSLKRSNDESSSSHQSQAAIFVSSCIEDRASTFIAHYSPFLSAKDLQKQPGLKSATHRIAAWRKPSAQQSLRPERIYETGHDDDGESYAGKRLEKVLSETKVEGAVVVARWYGGILLGPVRFHHIENCAKEAISKYLENSPSENTSPKMKKARVAQEDASRKAGLVKVLEKRDGSIETLRQHDLLLMRKAKSSSQCPESPPSGQVLPKKPDYSNMSVEHLCRLEKARDATIKWLLQQINDAEKAGPPISAASAAQGV